MRRWGELQVAGDLSQGQGRPCLYVRARCRLPDAGLLVDSCVAGPSVSEDCRGRQVAGCGSLAVDEDLRSLSLPKGSKVRTTVQVAVPPTYRKAEPREINGWRTLFGALDFERDFITFDDGTKTLYCSWKDASPWLYLSIASV